MGDEVNRSQMGNNNAYCQDNEITWMRWDFKPEDRELFKFVRDVLAFESHTPYCTGLTSSRAVQSMGRGLKTFFGLTPPARR